MKAPEPADGIKLLADNRRARHRYEIEERLEVGIALVGSEVKSVRAGKIELVDAYAVVQGRDLVLLNSYIAPWPFATMIRHEERRPRRLLAHRTQIDRLGSRIAQRGYTLVPMKVYLKGGRVKLELGLGRGKSEHDRREDIRERETEREVRAATRRYRDR